MSTPAPPDFEQFRPMRSDGSPRREQPSGQQPGRRRRRRPPPRPPRRSWVGRIFFAIAAVVILLAGAATAAIFVFSPAELVRTELIRQVKSNTGRTLTIAGAPSLTFYPSIGVALPSVSLSPPPGMAGGPMIRADRINVSVAFMPLLSGRAVVEQINLVRPIIDLRVDQSGRRSWDFAIARKRTRVAGLPSSIVGIANGSASATDVHKAAFLAAQPGKGLEALDALELRSIRISQGLVQYLDQRQGRGEVVSDVNINVTGQRIADPISLAGDLTWNRQRLNIQARLTTLRKLLHGQPAQADVVLKSNPTNAKFNGTVTLGNAPTVIGDTQLTAASLQTLLRWTGTELPNGRPLGGLSLSGKLNASAAKITLNGSQFKLGQSSANGSVAVHLNRARPLITANLSVSQLDIDKLSAQFAGVRQLQRPQPKPLSNTTSGSAGGAPPKSIEEILRGTQSNPGGAGRFSTQVRGFTKTKGWSRDPIDVTALRSIDADARLKVAGLRVAGLSIGQTSLTTKLTAGNARIDILDILLYGGRGRGVLTAAGSNSGVKVGVNISVNGISAQPLLKDAADFDLIAGRGRLTAALSSAGRSQQDIMSGLAGRAGFVFEDGAIVGWNIPQMLRGLQTGQISNFSKTAAAKTDFSALTANFNVSRGIANTQDLRMNSPLLRLTGSGNTDLGRRQLDMILRPKLVASLAGQGGQANLGGIEVPVRINGSWDKPKVTPDLAGALANRGTVNNVVNNVKKLRDKFKGKKAGEIVRQLLDGNDDGDDGNLGKAAGNLLKNLFKN